MTQLDISLLSFFMPIFSFLLVFAIVYAVMDKFNVLGKGKVIKITVAFTISLVFMFSPRALQFVLELVPWFVVMLVLILIIFATLMFMGVSEGDLTAASKKGSVYWIILSFVIIGLLLTFGKVFGSIRGDDTPNGEEHEDPNGGQNTLQSIFSAKVLGALILLIIAVFAMQNITKHAVD